MFLTPATSIRKVAILGNHIPRRCGIATFTADVAKNVAQNDQISVDVFAMNDGKSYKYDRPVRFAIEATDLDSYRQAVEILNREKYDVLNIQHEFGIYGGPAGEMVLEIVRNVKMPIVTTLHTILQTPNQDQERVLMELLQLSERVVVMSEKGAEILITRYGVSESRIELIPHGIHEVDQARGIELRSQHQLNGRPLILTFGLLSPDKGIHNMIDAMREVAQSHPEAIYVVLGATHPHVAEHHGEAYRESLERKVSEFNLGANVRFVAQFVSNEDLAGWLAAADIYVTPYLKPEQITSGTLAYALGAGNAVVSTPYWHAEELLADERGILVPFGSSASLAEVLDDLLANPARRRDFAKRAFDYSRSMTWPKVGKHYLGCFEMARQFGADRLKGIVEPALATREVLDLPRVDLTHVCAMTDDTGMLQHATFTIPNRFEGYCTDDNARALILLETMQTDSRRNQSLRRRYLSFLGHAWNDQRQSFRNFMSYDRRWLEEIGSEDSQARAMWALSYTATNESLSGERYFAEGLLKNSLPQLQTFTSLRSWAFGILALTKLASAKKTFEYASLIEDLANRIMECWHVTRGADWDWFEPTVAYDNARIPQALIAAGEALNNDLYLRAGERTLKWLMNLQTGPGNFFAPIGSDHFYERGTARSWFDQQPIEACASVSACLTASKVFGSIWLTEAERAMGWFFGKNTVGVSMVDSAGGICYDGLTSEGRNQNCGAESTLSYLIALSELRQARRAALDAPSRVNIA